MPISPNFSAAQSPANPNIIVLADTSTGSDVAITQRRAYIQTAEGTYLVPAGTTTTYIQWPLANLTINCDVLTRDMAATIRVDWLDVSNTVLYSSTQSFCFSIYTKQFLYYLVQGQAYPGNIIQDTNYAANLANLWAALKGAINAVELASDISASQSQLNICYNYITNQSMFF